ncbi:LTA synthase family protein [Siminovitchia fortis]|uniref:LTA synthase family protein n=1 Tax=Siminovitchia fortis TaxID=254758 RepID=A0A443IJU6_9BACI|nr:LTA synthase family protein [Siminovitchia fortis]RWR04795.1 LTA synthase family protein [Siminovitchia fortis]WHY81029.1 LTA synthase family protein [Siminovitchia fortis]
MSKWKKEIILGLYFLLICVVMGLNSTVIVEWLNKSLFVDFSMDANFRVNESFYNGVSFVFLIFLIMYAIFGTFIVSILMTNLLFGALVFANQIKVKERNEFITFKELQTIGSPKELLSFIDVPMGTALLIIISVISLLAILHFISKGISKKMNFRIGTRARVGILLIALIPLFIIFTEPSIYNKYVLKYEDAHTHNFNPVLRAQRNGFIPSFIQTVKPNYMNKPAHYNKKNMLRINDKYTKIAGKINENRKKSLNDSQTIFYLSESLMDPMALPGLIKNETPTPYISGIIKNHIGGKMYSQYVGGGTANIEWSVLTSFSLEVFNEPLSITPYSDFYVEAKNHHTALDFFQKDKVAIHPFTANLYKRRSVYSAIGFDDFLYLDNGIKHTGKLGTHKRVADKEFHKDILRVASDDKVGFIHALTMQNHSPYTGEIPEMDYRPEINFKIYPKKEVKGLVNYLQGLKASDGAIEQLVKELASSDKEINLVLYGDHFPSLFRGLEEQFPNDQLHETPWFIYMNHGRSDGGVKLDGISPIFFTTVLLREGNYYVTPFQGLMDELLDQDVKRVGNNFVVTDQGKVMDEDLADDILEMVEDYRSIVYDALFGADWLPDQFFTFTRK